jgi:predicted dehydrogenase
VAASATGLRVGFIGAGWTDRVQIPAFKLGGLTAQAIASGSVENARRVAQKHGIPQVCADWRELVAADEVDVVSIVTPPHLHREIATAALQAGKHVICEKPTALNVAEAEAMFAAAQAAPGQLAIVDHELRFHPTRLHMRELIKDGFVGRVVRVELDRLGGERMNSRLPYSWWSDASRGGGMLGATGSHLIDLARWMVGRIDAVAGQLQVGCHFRTDPETGRQEQVTADEHADILVQFGGAAGGVRGRITASGITPGARGLLILVVGSDGALRLDNEDRLWAMRGDAYPGGAWEAVRPKYPPADLSALPAGNPFAVGSYYLAQTLATSLPMGETQLAEAASFYDGLVVQRVMDAVQRSHREQAWVRL